MGRTGVFITAMSEIERVKVEGEVDIFQTVKAIRVQRPNMVSTVVSYTHVYTRFTSLSIKLFLSHLYYVIQDQYKLCHEILQAYLDSFDTYANFKAV